MQITASQIKELRSKTGAGMMDCKRALERAAGEQEKAIAMLKELGLVQEKKREDRETNEGRIFVRTVGERCIILKLVCETDFVSRNQDFLRLGEACLDMAYTNQGMNTPEMFSAIISETAMKIREKLVLTNIRTIVAGDNEYLQSYIHGEGRIGAVVRLYVSEQNKPLPLEIRELIADLALHAAAFAPKFLSRSVIEPGFLDAKKDEFIKDVRNLGKKETMIEAIVKGKLDKFQKKVCFLEQPFLRDEKRTVNEVLEDAGKALGRNIKLTGFLYEGIGFSPV